MWCSIGLYLQHGAKEAGGHSIITLDRNLGQNHHIYQGSFYNSVRLAQTLLDRNVKVCSTMRANMGIPRDLEGEKQTL